MRTVIHQHNDSAKHTALNRHTLTDSQSRIKQVQNQKCTVMCEIQDNVAVQSRLLSKYLHH